MGGSRHHTGVLGVTDVIHGKGYWRFMAPDACVRR